MTLKHMLLDSNKFLVKKYVTETHCNRLAKNCTSKLYQILKLLPVSLTMIVFPETLGGGLRQG